MLWIRIGFRDMEACSISKFKNIFATQWDDKPVILEEVYSLKQGQESL